MALIVAIVGKPKTGKTVSACTFPKPIAIMDWDRGALSATTAKDKSGKLIIPDNNQIIPIEMYKKSFAPLSFKSFTMNKGNIPSGRPEYTEGAPDVMTKHNAIMNELGNNGGCYVKEGVKYGPFQTLIIDPLTQMFRIWKDSILFENNVMDFRRGDYLTLEGVLFNQFIPTIKAMADVIPYIVLIDHEDFDADEKGNIINEFPVGPTKNMGKMLSEAFDEVWRMEVVNESYKWRTRKHGNFIGAGSRLALPDPITPATFQELQKYLPKDAIT